MNDKYVSNMNYVHDSHDAQLHYDYVENVDNSLGEQNVFIY